MSERFSTQIDKALFDAAQGIEDAEARRAFVDGVCSGNEERRDRLERWLALAGDADDFFKKAALVWKDSGDVTLALTSMAAAIEPSAELEADEPGSKIGCYRLVERIGEGGCGVVYLAEQLEPVRRRVALKVIRLGLDTEHVIARFEMERQALALMQHPNIATVLDAGTTEQGRPYFVMELVSGVKITTHCDEQRLGLRERLELFLQVCQAIQHAHQKGVIHRDIKPSNILVSMRDGIAEPKVIDFGIARATEGRLSDHTAVTAGQLLLGTPAYMSPEQAEGGPDLDTRADVYSLGVLLVELLTGHPPFDSERLAKAGLLETLRILREEEAPAPSASLAGLPAEELVAVAEQRGTQAARLIAAVRGELDWIALKALAKDRRSRYETINGLAMDVRRYLDDEPVLASSPGRFYLLGKTVRRHKALFGSAAAVVTALVVGLGTSNWLYSRERAARREAEEARANAARLLQQSKARESVSLAAILLAEGKVAEADALLEKTPPDSIEPSLEAATLFRTLGDSNAVRQRWKPSAKYYLLFLQANRLDRSPAPPSGILLLICIAPTLMQAGCSEEYASYCEEVVARYGGVKAPVENATLLKACLLAPTHEKVLAALRSHAEALSATLNVQPRNQPEAYTSAFAALSLAMMSYRSGDFTGTLEWTRKCLGYPDANQAREAAAHALAAMSAQQLGDADQAQMDLAKTRKLFEAPFARDQYFPRGQGQGIWLDWAIAEVLKREAEGLVK